jgi:ATP-binding cassette subfamily C (CFTR/MRP) protein 1
MFRETLSPMFNYVTESMNGRRVITAFGSEQRLRIARNYGEKVDQATRILMSMWTFETWVAIRCLFMESLLTSSLLIALIAFGHDPSYSNQPATIGLLLFLLLNIRDDMKNSFANWNLLEKDLACVQRILEYIDVEPEGALSQNQLPLDPFWQRKGSITFQDVFFQYDGAEAQPHPPTNAGAKAVLTGAMALKNVSFHIEGGQKIGVVGRSGAGKSSLAMALMRVNDPAYGVIQIDGVDVTRLHLKTLRSKVSYVPPNPVFTNSSLREYLDPMNHVDDAVLWKILKKTGVEASILKVQASLDAPIMGTLSNWSMGERQLLCLARALVFRSRIVILDEATTATDQETDCSVQDLVYEILDSSTTLLCIAHRLDTVLEFDKILVMADGGVEDFGTVQELVASGDGVFYNLLESAQLVY